MSNRSANMPFRFVSCMELREVLGKRAMDEHRLLELIEEVPADSIYYHTHSYFLRHASTQQLYSNDFATWVVLYAQDRVLGERVGVPRDNPILLQVSRFDRFTDPVSAWWLRTAWSKEAMTAAWSWSGEPPRMIRKVRMC